ncbi:MAG: hypothetical protein HOE90_04150 [Bacteriovoracaceae bacterium]|nr:hypothetical protein [Bacteriovoracaceae bacterium]
MGATRMTLFNDYTKDKWNEDYNNIIKAVSCSENYREFLNSYILHLKTKSQSFGYTELGRRSGLTSRSHPRDVTLGIKN